MDGTFSIRNSTHLDHYTPRERAWVIELEDTIGTRGISFLPLGVMQHTGDWGKYLSM